MRSEERQFFKYLKSLFALGMRVSIALLWSIDRVPDLKLYV